MRTSIKPWCQEYAYVSKSSESRGWLDSGRKEDYGNGDGSCR